MRIVEVVATHPGLAVVRAAYLLPLVLRVGPMIDSEGGCQASVTKQGRELTLDRLDLRKAAAEGQQCGRVFLVADYLQELCAFKTSRVCKYCDPLAGASGSTR